jgi:5-formyltetrahydrofolate cyclo-ligase
MKKSALRSQANQLRKELPTEALKALSQQLLKQFQAINLNGVKVLHIFLPIAEKNEPDTFLFIELLKKNHPHIKNNAYNILEPSKVPNIRGTLIWCYCR